MRFPTRPSIRSVHGSKPQAAWSSWGKGGQDPLSCPAKKKPKARRNEGSNAYENHEMGLHCGVARGGDMGLLGKLPNTAGISGLRGRPPACPGGMAYG